LRTALNADTLSKRKANSRLLSAAETGDATAAALAIRAGANLEARDGRGRTPLLLAVTKDRLAVARLLVYLGADPDALDDQHDTPWLVTGVTGSVDMLEVLLPARPDLAIRNRFGGTSLIPASERGHVGYVRRVVRTDRAKWRASCGTPSPCRRQQVPLAMRSLDDRSARECRC